MDEKNCFFINICTAIIVVSYIPVHAADPCGRACHEGYINKVLAVDEEMGLVFAYSIFVHNGEPKIMKIAVVPGITERPNNYGPFDLPATHIFKIRNGKIYEIEAIGYVTKHGTKNGWE